MKFRPCIDIHNGFVKQLVGGSMHGDVADVNFTSDERADKFAKKYRKDGLDGGHIVILNSKDSPGYEASRRVAIDALEAFPGGFQIGGGITDETAYDYILHGASHVIVTSFIFDGDTISLSKLDSLADAIGKERIVIDLSCRKKDGDYYVVTDRWQTFTNEKVDAKLLRNLSDFCDEFLIHGVDSEGLKNGMEEDLIRILAEFDGCPVTYAGGITTGEDIKKFAELGKGKLDFTIGSALDLFGGDLPYDEVKLIK